MSAQLPFLDRSLGHPLVQNQVRGASAIELGYQLGAEDPEEADDLAGVYLGAMRWGPMAAMQAVRARMQQRRAMRGGGCRHMQQPGIEGLGYFGGIGGDEDDTEDFAADEQEVGSLEADDEDVGADDSPAEINGGIARLNRKTAKIKAKIQELQLKLAATPEYRRMKRNRIQRHIDRLKRSLSRKEERLDRKEDKLRRKYGVVPVPVDRGLANRAAAYGVDASTYAAMEANADRPDARGVYVGSAPVGEEIGLPILFTGADYLKINFPTGGAAGATGSISGETDQNNYATLQITALQISITFAAESQATALTDNDDVALVPVITSLTPEGGLNAFYGNQNVNVSGFQTGGDGYRRIVKRLTGLRENAILRQNRTATLSGTIYQALANTGDIDVLVEAQVVCRVLSDEELRRRGV